MCGSMMLLCMVFVTVMFVIVTTIAGVATAVVFLLPTFPTSAMPRWHAIQSRWHRSCIPAKPINPPYHETQKFRQNRKPTIQRIHVQRPPFQYRKNRFFRREHDRRSRDGYRDRECRNCLACVVNCWFTLRTRIRRRSFGVWAIWSS